VLGVIFSTSVQDIVLIDYENKLKEVENNNNNKPTTTTTTTTTKENGYAFGQEET